MSSYSVSSVHSRATVHRLRVIRELWHLARDAEAAGLREDAVILLRDIETRLAAMLSVARLKARAIAEGQGAQS